MLFLNEEFLTDSSPWTFLFSKIWTYSWQFSAYPRLRFSLSFLFHSMCNTSFSCLWWWWFFICIDSYRSTTFYEVPLLGVFFLFHTIHLCRRVTIVCVAVRNLAYAFGLSGEFSSWLFGLRSQNYWFPQRFYPSTYSLCSSTFPLNYPSHFTQS